MLNKVFPLKWYFSEMWVTLVVLTHYLEALMELGWHERFLYTGFSLGSPPISWSLILYSLSCKYNYLLVILVEKTLLKRLWKYKCFVFMDFVWFIQIHVIEFYNIVLDVFFSHLFFCLFFILQHLTQKKIIEFTILRNGPSSSALAESTM